MKKKQICFYAKIINMNKYAYKGGESVQIVCTTSKKRSALKEKNLLLMELMSYQQESKHRKDLLAMWPDNLPCILKV